MYLLYVVPGLERIAFDELIERCPATQLVQTVERFDERTSMLQVSCACRPDDLLGLGTVEDVFVLAAANDRIPSNRAGLAAIRSTIAGSVLLDSSVTLALSVRPGRRGKIRFRVIARKSGDHAFRRVDLQRASELGLLDCLPHWRLVEDDAQLEVWVTLVGSRFLAGIRVSDASMRYRMYRTSNLPAALKPTIARAMTVLSAPQPDDVFLDPMCGTGTILIERALAARYRLLLGGDRDPNAVQAARDNIGPRYKPIEVHCWDARALPLEDRSVSAIVTNLPFGKQIGSAQEIQDLYPRLLQEWLRVLQSDGKMVLLTSEQPLLRRAVAQHRNLHTRRQEQVLVRGLRATISVLETVT